MLISHLHFLYLHIPECPLRMQSGSEHFELGRHDENAVEVCHGRPRDSNCLGLFFF